MRGVTYLLISSVMFVLVWLLLVTRAGTTYKPLGMDLVFLIVSFLALAVVWALFASLFRKSARSAISCLALTTLSYGFLVMQFSNGNICSKVERTCLPLDEAIIQGASNYLRE